MKQFFKFFFASLTALFIFSFLGFLILVGIVAIASADEEIEVEANSVLWVDLGYAIPERTSDNPFQNFDPVSMTADNPVGLDNILASIEAAKDDDKIKCIYLDMNAMPSGLATVDAVRDALVDFKESGKSVIAYGDLVSQKAYYLASAADEVYMNPEGYFAFNGIGVQLAFLKGTLDKLEIEMQPFYVGKYKSAFEPLARKDISEPNEEQIRYLFDDITNHFMGNIADGRGMTIARLNEIANNLEVTRPKDALANGMIDNMLYWDELVDILHERAGSDSEEDLNTISVGKYSKTVKKGKGVTKDKIAVVYASGSIVDGEGEVDNIGGTKFGKTIAKLRKDDNVKAIVLRVNSGGGSALASEIMWREVGLASEEKPVIVSMGDVAASGGYYIACNADKIYAEPSTITGSIGVFGVMPNMEKFFENKLGVTFDEVEMHEHAVFGTGLTPLDDKEKEVIQQGVDDIYVTFITRVADGRGMDTASVHKIAQGRVWTGNQALDNGLIDAIGGMDAAIADAASMADLEEYRLVSYPEEKDPFEELMNQLTGGSSAKVKAEQAMQEEMGLFFTYYQKVAEILEWNTYQTRIPFDLVIK